MSAALPSDPLVEYRTFFGVEVGIAHAAPSEGAAGTSWVIFPDGRYRQIRTAGYANFEDACAAEVAVWRKRRIRLGIDKPEAPGAKPLDVFDEVRAEANSETVTTECGDVGRFGAKCIRQIGHEYGDTKHARAHYGRVKTDGPDHKFIDDGDDHYEIWKRKGPLVTLH